MGLGGLGMGEILLIFLVVLLLFGAKRLPEIGGSLGKGIREFKSSVKEIEREIKTEEPRRTISKPAAEDTRVASKDDADADEVPAEPRRLTTNNNS